MIKYVISTLYINEAIRLRKKYFDVIENIALKKDELLECSTKLEKIKDYISTLEIDDIHKAEFTLSQQQDLIEEQMQRIHNKLKPDYDELTKIEEDTKRLQDALKEKYKGITAEEIKNQIQPHLYKARV
jgi:deoxyhypusine synthase